MVEKQQKHAASFLVLDIYLYYTSYLLIQFDGWPGPFSSHPPHNHIFFNPLRGYNVGLPHEFSDISLLMRLVRACSRVQTKTSKLRASPAYLKADNGSQGEREKTPVQPESMETENAAPTKVPASVLNMQFVCIGFMAITEADEREKFRVRCLLPAFLTPLFCKIASTTWYHRQLRRAEESQSADPVTNSRPRACPRVFYAPSPSLPMITRSMVRPFPLDRTVAPDHSRPTSH